MSGQQKPSKMSGHQLAQVARFQLMAEQQLKNLGAAIQRARKEKGWSRPILAREIPVDPKTIERWEKGQSGGAMESLGNIAEALGVDADDILADAVPRNESTDTPDVLGALSTAAPATSEEIRELSEQLAELRRFVSAAENRVLSAMAEHRRSLEAELLKRTSPARRRASQRK